MKPSSLKSLLINLLVIGTLGASLILFFFYIYLPSSTNHGETITVPSVIEANYSELEDLLKDKDLRYEVNDSTYDSKYPPLTVLMQYPAPGTKVKEGRKVFVTLNKDEIPQIEFPPFDGKSITHVKAVMQNLDFKLGKIISKPGPLLNLVLEIRYQGEPIEEGQLIPKGSELDVVVADGNGKSNFQLATLWNMEFKDAEFLIKGQDLNMAPLNIPKDIDTTDMELFVVRQDPLPKSEVTIGEYVELWVEPERDSAFYFVMQMDTARTKNRQIVSYLIDSIRNAPEITPTDSSEVSSLDIQ